MRYRLPSLNALRAFEAAGRRGSLSAAATELGVTVGAVSRHVALLEAHFGRALLERHPAGTRLTAAGSDYFSAIGSAFDSIDAASQTLARGERHGPLKLRFYSSFATEWLAPRLPAFRATHPQVELDLVLATGEADWNGDFDLAMTATPPSDDRFHRDQLFETRFALVCAPSLAAAPDGIVSAADLTAQTLLAAPRERAIWPVMLDALGAAPFTRQRVLEFESLSLTYQAARGRAGVALGNLFMIADDLQNGRLILPFARVMRIDLPHYLVSRRNRLGDTALTLFRRWLMDEASSCEAMLDPMIRQCETVTLSLPPSPAFQFSQTRFQPFGSDCDAATD
ncbi:LysR substrate-binding domain-containing protein [Sphingomonas colocasiae]|uniref:LysR family transcriptional regulator n=1 Tax=Sphingomonas colocasiae TaxID=1848973 RepID=A0ABS7PSL8_9SPHN|nr:LysR substrate-binding domain-containing protein [Sphingomonas colocasiae]MBY8824337.1 LysR family transcriptional regulator [Sphingomonas colocasiae]